MKYGFLGCGNMGGAIARAISKATNSIMLTDRSGKAKNIAKEIGCVYSNAQQVAEQCERIFLAVKPQMMAAALTPIRATIQEKKPLLITMAAGLKLNDIRDLVGCDLPIIRIMPNTPAAIGMGMTVYCCNEFVSPEILNDFVEEMRFTGRMDAIDEHLIDAASALSGSGPAYLYVFMEALADGAVSCGIPRSKALEYAAVTMAGAANLMLSSGQHPGVLKDAVCSPAGSTIAGIQVLEERGFRGTVMDCVTTAYHRNIELGQK